MRVLWICGLPQEVQEQVLRGQNFGAYAAWSWIMGHLPPPPGIELHIACRTARGTPGQSFEYKGATFHLVPVGARARLFCLYQLDWLAFRAVMERVKPELIHGWGTEDAYGWCALRLAPRSHLIQIQGNINTYRKRVRMPWQSRLAALSERLVLARARHVVAENRYSLESAQPFTRTNSLHVVEHPLRGEFLQGSLANPASKQALFVGALEARKGLWEALQAFAQAAPPDWKLALVGDGPTEAWQRLNSEVRRLHLESRVTHCAQCNATQISALMRQSSVFFLPTHIDTGPTALKEALAMGLWPVCYDNSGPAHYQRLFGVGSLARDMDEAALAKTLQEVLQSQPWQKPDHARTVTDRIRPALSAQHVWEDLRQLYSHIQAG